MSMLGKFYATTFVFVSSPQQFREITLNNNCGIEKRTRLVIAVEDELTLIAQWKLKWGFTKAVIERLWLNALSWFATKTYRTNFEIIVQSQNYCKHSTKWLKLSASLCISFNRNLIVPIVPLRIAQTKSRFADIAEIHLKANQLSRGEPHNTRPHKSSLSETSPTLHMNGEKKRRNDLFE